MNIFFSVEFTGQPPFMRVSDFYNLCRTSAINSEMLWTVYWEYLFISASKLKSKCDFLVPIENWNKTVIHFILLLSLVIAL
jgi:hypothetical protein